MKVKKGTKHPCLKGLLQTIMYQREDKSRSLRHSRRKALTKYKVQHWALICRSISLPRAECLSMTWFHIPAPKCPPKSTLGRSRQIQSLYLFSFSSAGGFHSPCLQSQQLQRKGAHLFPLQNSNSAAESLQTPCATSFSPKPKTY